MLHPRTYNCSTVLWAGLLLCALAHGQSPIPVEQPPERPGMVMLNLPENVEISVLADYVGQRMGLNFIYDEQVRGKLVTLKVTQEIPVTSLMALLESALRAKGLAITETGIPGTLRIETGSELPKLSRAPGEVKGAEAVGVVTTLFRLRHASTTRVEPVLTPFLSISTASLTSIPEHGMLIVTDYASNMRKLGELITMLDQPGSEAVVRFVPVSHLPAASLAQKLTALLTGQPGEPASVTVVADERTNQVAVIGQAARVGGVMDLLKSLDVSLGLETRIYRFAVASPEQVDRLVRELIGEVADKRLYKATADREANLLIATATSEIHAQIELLRRELDIAPSDTQSRIRFYKLKYARAEDVLNTIISIEGGSDVSSLSLDGPAFGTGNTVPAAYRGPTEPEVNDPGRDPDRSQGSSSVSKKSVRLRDARVIADAPTNQVIVVAEPPAHPTYERLIHQLDIRRPQVLVEATVVEIDTTNGFSLGVEVIGSDGRDSDDRKALNFSSFGLSSFDPNTSSLRLTPGVGFNGAVLTADVASVVIRALESDSRARVVARPSVLINDNAEGELSSEAEEPFATLNSNGIAGATTSLGGFVSAGTRIVVVPQISEDESLKLEYDITLSSFSSDGSDVLPPSRKTNHLKSEATIPDGHTIVVGGLTRNTFMEAVDRVPLLGKIPVVEYFFSSRVSDKTQTTLFVFIRATILRDDKFKDLKLLSADAATEADLPGDSPTSEPVGVR